MITQADREAALQAIGAEFQRGDDIDWDDVVEAFAAHRIAEREAVVKWLRGNDNAWGAAFACRIAAGEHITPPTA